MSVLVDDMAHSLTFFFFVFFLLHCSRCLGSDIIAKEAKNKPTSRRVGASPSPSPHTPPLESFRERSACGGACGVACRRRPAGGKLGSAICFSTRGGEERGGWACLWRERMRECAVLYITAKAVGGEEKNKNNPFDIPLSRRRDRTLEERECVEA